MGRLLYFVREALRGFYQAKLMTSVSIFTVAVSLFVLGIAVVGALTLTAWLRSLSGQADIVAYVEDTASADSAGLVRVAARVAEFPQVDSLAIVTKSQAWERFQQMYGSEMLDMVDDNPLPASFEVSLGDAYTDPKSVQSVSRELSTVEGIESVDYSAGSAQQLQRVRLGVWLGVIALALLCFLVLHFVVANTVKLTIYARKDLVVNMRFVGATDAFIATPFMLEGILQGGLGGLIALVGAWVLKVSLPDTFAVDWGPPYTLSAVILVLGVGFGWWGSFRAVGRFLA